jgi:hypothetical protein
LYPHAKARRFREGKDRKPGTRGQRDRKGIIFELEDVMSEYQDEQILLSNLKLDNTNPRHPEFESQREIIEWMTSGNGKIGEKLIVLAKDIAIFGLNPADRVMVMADDDEKGQFIVLEGNRRLTALKLLNNPDLAPTNLWQKRFSKLRPGYSPINKISCTVFNDEKIAFHFIELRHLGESGGAGIVPWEAEQKARHDQRLHRRSRHHKALAILDFLRSSEGIDPETKKMAGEGIPITTLDRILSDKEFRDFLGLHLDSDGEICFRIEPREALKPISKVIKDLGSGSKNVRHVINKEQREQYKDSFKDKSIPDHSKVLIKPVRVAEAETRLSEGTRSGSSSGKRYGDPRDRKRIVISGTNLPIDPRVFNRAKRVFEELKEVEIRDRHGKPHFPNAGILLLRLFIEMSVDLYIKQHKLTHTNSTGWINIPLTERTKAVLRDLDAKQKIDSQDLKVINKALGDPNKVSNPNSLNDLAHNPNQIPHPHDLYDVWDTYTKFLFALWQNIK